MQHTHTMRSDSETPPSNTPVHEPNGQADVAYVPIEIPTATSINAGAAPLVPLNTASSAGCCERPSHLFAASSAVFPAIGEAIPIVLGMLDASFNSLQLSLAIPMVALQAFMMNGKYIYESIGTSYTLLTTREIPDDWPKLPRNKEITSVVFTVLSASYAALADAVEVVYFVAQLFYEKLGWINLISANGMGISFGVLTAICNLFSEGMETYKTMRETLAGTHSKFSLPARVIGYVLGVISAIEDIIESYISMTNLFDVNDGVKQYVILCLGITNGIGDFCFQGKIGTEAIHEFFARLSQGRPTVKEFLLFGVSGFLASQVAIAQGSLLVAMLAAAETLPFVLPGYIPHIIGWTTMAQQCIVQTYIFYQVSSWITKKAGNCCTAGDSVQTKPTSAISNGLNNALPKPYSSQNPHTQFSAKQPLLSINEPVSDSIANPLIQPSPT